MYDQMLRSSLGQNAALLQRSSVQCHLECGCFTPQAMGAMNRQMNMPALQKIMRDFEMQNERMEMTSDVMGDAIDDAFEVSQAGGRRNCLQVALGVVGRCCRWRI
jgi:Snf7